MLLFPNAKINLGLDILRRRPDGYHDICTAMVPTGWTDVLELTPMPGGQSELVTTGRTVECPPEKNLVMKALRAMEALTGGVPPTRLHLHKVIPDGAGLGGGSADAAFTLVGLNRLYHLGLPDDTLEQLAAGIGADCPFFVANRPMLCTGTGTTLHPLELPQLRGLALAIAKPPVSVPTAQAYSRVTPREPAVPLAERLSRPVECWQDSVANDFEASVFPLHPRIAAVKQTMLAAGAIYAAMSGSGSAVFGLFAHTDADKLSAMLAPQLADCCCHFSAL